jgi:hypothetical protein
LLRAAAFPEGSVELRIGPQQIDLWKLIVSVAGFGLIEDRAWAAEKRLKRIVDQRAQLVTGILPAQCRGDEVAVAGAVIPAPRQMRGAVGGVVDAKHDLSGERLLQTQVPLVDFRVARFLEI